MSRIKASDPFIVVAGFFFTGSAAGAADTMMGSLFTSLKEEACTKAVDESDPNQLSYLVCAGLPGYQLQVHDVDSGRVSVTVVTPDKKEFPLNYPDVVTRSMNHLDDKAEWRVPMGAGNPVPVALVVRVMAHESAEDPEKVTKVYWAVAKITADEVCVTDRIVEGSKSETDVRALADSAAGKPCAKPLPH